MPRQAIKTEGGKSRHVVFAREFVANGGNATKAATFAEYASPRTSGYDLLQIPNVQLMIQKEQVLQIKAIGVTEAIATLRSICTDISAPHGARVEASKAILGLAKFTDRIQESSDKPLSQMTIEELDNVIKQGQQAIAMMSDSAQIVEGEVITVVTAEELKADMMPAKIK